jgi:hypothetical protein
MGALTGDCDETGNTLQHLSVSKHRTIRLIHSHNFSQVMLMKWATRWAHAHTTTPPETALGGRLPGSPRARQVSSMLALHLIARKHALLFPRGPHARLPCTPCTA